MSSARLSGQIVSITFTPEGVADPKPPGFYVRVPFAEAELVAERGIRGDRKGRGGNRQLNIMSAETLAVLTSEGFKAAPGELGEQIIVAGLDINVLEKGTRLRFGATAIVEIDIPRTGCDRFEKIQNMPKGNARGRLGVMARVVAGGVIRVGDAVVM